MNHSTSQLTKIRRLDATEKIYRPTVKFLAGQFLRYDRLSWVFQAFLSLLGLIALSPVFLVIGLLIKLLDKGPVFYRGERIGCGERVFRIYKFRTLTEGAEEKIGARLLCDDDRNMYYTRVGSFLKRTKLDELPQLLNVIRGEMRLVGPRPARPVFMNQAKQEIPNYTSRLLVPPGITGIAQLRGGYYTSPRNKLRYDLIYIKNRSFILDLKLIFLTIVKILDRWLSRGFFVLFLFLFVLFIPITPEFGTRFLLYFFIILLAAWIFAKKGPAQFTLYRCPLNLAVLLFVLVSVVSTFFADDPQRALRHAGYYVGTGFLVSLMIVNDQLTKGFITGVVRVIALTSVSISLIGLFEISIFHNTVTRISSILGSPVALSVYLVLGIPLLLSEVRRAPSRGQRDFWLVCTTISIVGIFFTQTRVGLLALLVTGTVFFCRRLRHALSFFVIILLCFLFLASFGVSRFSPSIIHGDVTQWIQEKTPIVRTAPLSRWLIGAGTGAIMAPQQVGEPERNEVVKIHNMHLTLILEYGIPGWLIFMWLILSSLWVMKQAHDKTQDEQIKTILWAIISCILGFLVSMNVINTFHNLTLQVFFWSLIGIGVGIVIQMNGHRRQNLIWRFGDAGDR